MPVHFKASSTIFSTTRFIISASGAEPFVCLKIIDLIREAKGGGSSYPEGINTSLAKALWNNYMDWDSTNTDKDIRVQTIEKIEKCIEEDAYDQWRDASSPDGLNFIQTLTELLKGKTDEEIQAIYNFARQNTNE